MRKYANNYVNSLKKTEITEILDKEGVAYNKSDNIFALRKALSAIESEPELVGNQEEVAEVEQEEAPVQEKPIEEPAPQVSRALFKEELAKRMSRAGKATRSAFAVELARRKGQTSRGKSTFAEELAKRKLKNRK